MSAGLLIASLGWTLLHFVWQGAIVGGVAALLLVALRRARPETRYAVACAALLVCALWPAVEFATLLRTGAAAPAGSALAQADATNAVLADENGALAWLQARLDWIVGLWAACAAALGLRMALGLLWIRRAAGAPAAAPVWQARLSAMVARAGLTRDIRLRVVDTLTSPVTAGFWRPVVLVPAALLTGMPAPLLEALLAHELGHIKRHDYLVNLCQHVVETLLFYHPAVWWISRRIRVEREQIADDFAARTLGEPRRLALALSELERLQFSHAHLAQAASGGDLMARIRRLLRPDVGAFEWKAALPALGLAVACAASAHALALRGDAAPAAGRITSRAAIADFGSCAKPEYPAADIAASHEGTVTLDYLISPSGGVSDSRVARSSGFASMDEAARAAIQLCRFKPAVVDGRQVAQWTKVMYVWTLQ
jgi:bla regulator protein BlaR1